MADKPTTPDPAGGRRRKRPAPTIDLTATEVPQKSQRRNRVHTTQSSVARSTPPNDAKAAPSPKPDRISIMTDPQTAGRLWQTVLAGCAARRDDDWSASCALVCRAGAGPYRRNDPRRIRQSTALAERSHYAKSKQLAKHSRGADPGVSERLSAADNAMKSLGIALTALTKHSEEAAAGAAEARARADAAEKAVTQLRNSVQDLSKNTSAGLSPADVDVVQKRLAALEQAAKSAPVDSAARLALSAAALRDAVTSGMPFTAELDEARSLGADERP